MASRIFAPQRSEPIMPFWRWIFSRTPRFSISSASSRAYDEVAQRTVLFMSIII